MKRTKLLLATGILFIIFTLLTCWANQQITENTTAYITCDTALLKPTKAGLLLGTSRLGRTGKLNPFFYNRIEAAAMLYHSGKINVIIVSGDNSQTDYNEPEDMKQELMKRGVPESAIYLDYAGFRTLDSVVRAKEIFGQQQFIVISQRFHNERAVYVARKKGIEAYGYNAADVSTVQGMKTYLREYLARDKAMLDLLLNLQPKFLGDKVNLP